jgi:hypothetical protein
VVGSCEKYNVSSGFIKGGDFFLNLSYYKLLVKDSAPWSYLLA